MRMHFKKGDRYYNVTLQPTFFGATSIVCSWGNCFSNLGGSKIILCKSDDEIQIKISDIKKRRKYRGYELIEI